MSAVSSLFSVTGKNILVTGGSRGIGFMIAKGFAGAGANVLLTSRDEKACAEAASEIDCQYVVSNVATREGCKNLAAEVSRVFNGNLHVLVNNVSTNSTSSVITLTRTLCRQRNWHFSLLVHMSLHRFTENCSSLGNRLEHHGVSPGSANLGKRIGVSIKFLILMSKGCFT